MRHKVCWHVLLALALATSALAQSQSATPIENAELRGPRGVYSALSGEPYVLYAESMPGDDWGQKINNAIIKLREGADGGTIMLPPGYHKVSTPIDFAANRPHNPKGIVLQGAGGAWGTQLVWEGPPNSVMITLPSPWHCQLRSLVLDANKVEGVTGVQFLAGWHRGWNVSRYLLIEDVVIRRCKIGLDIGNIYAPDLAQHVFRSLWLYQCETGVRVTGANVANLWFYGVSIDGGFKTGFKLVGHTARKIRQSADEPMPADGTPVLTDQDGHEVFWKDVPQLAVKQGMVDKYFGEEKGYYAGGGSPELVIYGLGAKPGSPDAWVIDTNFAPIRIYSARLEGPGGILRYTGAGIGDSRINTMLVDVSSVCQGESSDGNVIEFHGKGPLHLMNCDLAGSVGVANTRVFANGVHFMKKGTGFRQLPDTTGAVIHQTHYIHQQTVPVPTGARSVRVTLTGVNRQRDAHYQAMVTPKFRCGSFWVSSQDADGFIVNFEQAAPADASIAAMVSREPMLGANREDIGYWKEPE